MIEVSLNADHEVVLMLDMSGSMMRRDAPGGRSRIAYAAERLIELLERGPAHARVQLVTFGKEVHYAWGEPLAGVIEALRAAVAGDAEANMGAALKLALARCPDDAITEVLIVCDGAPSDMERYREALARNSARFRPLELSILSVGAASEAELVPWLACRPLEQTHVTIAEGRPTVPSLPPVPSEDDGHVLRAMAALAPVPPSVPPPPAPPAPSGKRGGKVRRR